MTYIPTVAEAAASIDHAILAPNLSDETFYRELEKAKMLSLYSVCVRPCDVQRAVAYLVGSNVKVGTVVGFPHGSSSHTIKHAEMMEALSVGAVEIDVVMNQSAIPNKKLSEEVRALDKFARAAKAYRAESVKVIFENANLTIDEIRLASQEMSGSALDFIKTSTGYASGGATLEDVEIMVNHRGTNEVKASGGIRTVNDFIAFWNAGVTRFGTSNSEIILNDLAKMHAGTFETAREGGAY